MQYSVIAFVSLIATAAAAPHGGSPRPSNTKTVAHTVNINNCDQSCESNALLSVADCLAQGLQVVNNCQGNILSNDLNGNNILSGNKLIVHII